MKCCGEGTEVLRKMKKFENDNRTHNTCTYVLHGGVDPDSLLISILHLIRLLLILKVSLPQPCRKRQRVADTKAKIGRGEGGRTNPIRCKGDPSRRKYTSNADEGHMVRPRSRKSWEAISFPASSFKLSCRSYRLPKCSGRCKVDEEMVNHRSSNSFYHTLRTTQSSSLHYHFSNFLVYNWGKVS